MSAFEKRLGLAPSPMPAQECLLLICLLFRLCTCEDVILSITSWQMRTSVNQRFRGQIMPPGGNCGSGRAIQLDSVTLLEYKTRTLTKCECSPAAPTQRKPPPPQRPPLGRFFIGFIH